MLQREEKLNLQIDGYRTVHDCIWSKLKGGIKFLYSSRKCGHPRWHSSLNGERGQITAVVPILISFILSGERTYFLDRKYRKGIPKSKRHVQFGKIFDVTWKNASIFDFFNLTLFAAGTQLFLEQSVRKIDKQFEMSLNCTRSPWSVFLCKIYRLPKSLLSYGGIIMLYLAAKNIVIEPRIIQDKLPVKKLFDAHNNNVSKRVKNKQSICQIYLRNTKHH